MTVLVKPLASSRVQDILALLSGFGRVRAQKEVVVSSWLIGQHYRQFADKAFFPALLRYYTGKVVTVILLQVTEERLSALRSLIGDAKPQPGSFRAELTGETWKANKETTGVVDNGIHCSDCFAEGQREARVWFGRPPLGVPFFESARLQRLGRIHSFLWSKLNQLGAEAVQFAGGTQNGLAIPEKEDDLDYRVMTNRPIDPMVEKAANIPGLVFDRDGVDPKTGAHYVKFEYPFDGGKADVAIVPLDAYRSKISAAHLADLLPEGVKEGMRQAKSVALSSSIGAYKAAKEVIRREIDARFNLEGI